MSEINHQDRAHAKLSASGSSRWINCPGSINAEKGYPDKSSRFADEGTLAHELADTCLKKGKDAEYYIDKKITGKVIEKDMARYVQEYLDYVLSHETSNSKLYTEERVDFSNIVSEGFGTMDSAVLDFNTKVCHIFDLKYGQGVIVDAFENTQGQMYALGLYNELGFLGDIESFRIHIVQPRRQNFSYWDISVEDLLKFGEYVKERAELALTPDAPKVPGDKQCAWCKARFDCIARKKFAEQTILSEFDNLDKDNMSVDKLTDQEKRAILDNKKFVESFLKDIEKSVFNKLHDGEPFEGYKLVEGRSIRKWNENAEQILAKKLGKDAYKKSLIGITDAQKKLGKNEIDNLTYKPEGKPTLAPNTDKRKAISIIKTEDCFEELH